MSVAEENQMSNNTKRLIGFRDVPAIVKRLDDYAAARGIDRSDVLRMILREKFKEPKK